ncbi:hypothetical protein ABFX02_08G003200 [Erythranthe guttata]
MMASSSIKVSYERLKKQDDDERLMEEDEEYKGLMEKAMGRLRKSRLRRLHVNNSRRRSRSGKSSSIKSRLKIPSLKRFLRRKARLVKLGLNKVYKRLKESQSHFGDLFAGNYLFMQVTPTPLKYAPSDHQSKSFANSATATAAAHNYHPHHHHALPSITANNNNIPS